MTYGFALLKRWLPRWLLQRLPDIDTLLAVFDELLTHAIRFVPGKSKPRPTAQNLISIMPTNQPPRTASGLKLRGLDLDLADQARLVTFPNPKI